MYKFRVPLSLLVAGLSGTAWAGQVVEVTLFPGQAGVVMEQTATLSAGQGVITVDRLPADLDTAGLRVSARGPEGLILGTLETRVVHGRDLAHPTEQALTERLQALEDQQRGITDEIRAGEIQLRLVERMGQAASPAESGLSPDQWPRAWQVVGEGALDILRTIQNHEQSLREVEADIQRIRDELETLQRGRRDTLEARVHYQSPVAGEAVLTLEYRVRHAGWRPLYEARLDTATGELRLVQRAELRQNTGQDWNDVILRLSTARPELGGRLPELQPWYVDVARPTPAPTARRSQEVTMDALMSMAPAPEMKAGEQMADLEAAEFSALYRIAGQVSIPSDNQPHRHTLAEHRLEASLSARAVPRLMPHAYLFAETTFEGAAPLPAGQVSLFQDGSLVGGVPFPSLQPGSPLRLSFGVDERIGIRYELDRDSRGQEGLIRRQQRLERAYLISVHNAHPRPVDVTVLDQLPVARDERIKVELDSRSTPPTERDVDGKQGVLAWHQSLEADARTRIRFAYTLTWPEDVEDIIGLR
ncbi:DUF4139 domain-containing protein [Ectothiorhodospira lacustris]|uniref:DUF4139 domain-containing protein n=1 Tax=Ectothiorhodospira lacustris TaxID=2899127 RepID=UPI001EE94FBE|nr:DUF4139 domain-containing protein [Ectothiorhodospira lacustris]MCG5511229.1 DUF4139 domain-containing protein [Ectothiorhodospira lacustris]MCG5522955.1 DUF4139 domain-containing protein [Ectothiorhodospira lacustris]